MDKKQAFDSWVAMILGCYSIQPGNLMRAIFMAKLHEQKVNDESKHARSLVFMDSANSWKQYNHKIPSPSNAPGILKTPMVNSSRLENSVGATSVPMRRMTTTELKARRDKGLCYNCDEKFHPGHKCKAKVFLLLTESGEDSEVHYEDSEREASDDEG
ncbi:hypothetical protein CFOL_v3_33159 [Cephalotus follicularis]|uniref:Uncharacterized protein n=1 Tax=Cephalotus follicularis TaxID=3775 RepID=A0A1Q3DB50_CEPFO|nr:hypothetical protein CFOL_v3_33159 [Cephalotus follicularis]